MLNKLRTNSILRRRVLLYSVGILFCLGILGSGAYIYKKVEAKNSMERQRHETTTNILDLTKKYNALKIKINEAQIKSPELDFKEEETLLVELKKDIVESKISEAAQIYETVSIKVNQKIADDEQKGTLTGIVLSGSTPLICDIKIAKEGKDFLDLKSDSNGQFSFKIIGGKHTVKITLSGYNDFSQDFEITAQKTTNLELKLTKKTAVESAPAVNPVPTPAPTQPVVAPSGFYSIQKATTELGTFTVHLLTVDLAGYKMVVDTAADGDCLTDCPIKSLSEFVSQNGGVAGIHGTYFCPTSYPACASETNSFYYKLFNTRLNQRINWSNGLGDYLPFLMIDQSGSAQYFESWSSAKDMEMQTAISCRPHLVYGGNVVLQFEDMDSDKERYSKISRGFIGVSGQTVYAGVVLSATITDSAYAVQALGINDAFNIDGGGSTALYYNGYKLGPGRNIPNAIVFVPR